MKKLILVSLTLLIGLILNAQTALNKTVPTSNVEQISVYGTSGSNAFYSTSASSFNYGCGDLNPTVVSSNSCNDVYNDNFVFGDTLCVTKTTEYVYGNSSSVFDGSNIYPTNIPVNSLATDGSTVYALNDYSGSYNVMFISGGTSNLPFTNITNSYASSYLDNYTDVDHFEIGGVQYLIFTDDNGLSLYDLSTGIFYATLTSATSTTESNGMLYYSDGNSIYEITSIDPNTNPEFKDVTSTEVYTVDTGQTINEFGFDIWGSNINVATSDGIYSECSTTVNIENENSMENINLYPNPNNGNFTISGVEAGTNIEITNISGQIVHSTVADYSDNLSIDLELPDGVYFLQLFNNGSREVIKFIKR